MPVSLDQIVAARRASVAAARRSADLKALERAALAHTPRGFRRALEAAAAQGVAVIAELKKASPSRGLIRAEFNAAVLARELEAAGAAALSVLTEEEHFQGSLANLRAASDATRLPCLRKDFMVDEFQLLEARACGADAVLLIVAALTDADLSRLARRSQELELDVLCEVHNQRELERAVAAGSTIIGVNNRDLRTFRVDLETAVRLAPLIPPGAVRVAESGIHAAGDLRRLRAAGYQAFLIGESLMQAQRPGDTLAKLMGEASSFKLQVSS